MMRRSLLTILVAVALAGAVLGGPLVSSAYADEQFRSELLQFIQQMREVAAALAQQGGPDQNAALAEAEQRILSLTPKQLTILRDAFAQYPNWKEIPGILDGLITRKGAQRKMLERHRHAETPARPTIRPVSVPLLPPSAADPWSVERAAFPEGVPPWVGPWEVRPVTADNCPAARAFGWTQTDVEIAADAALIADGILQAIPTDLVSVPILLVAVGLWAIPQGFLRGIEHNYNIAGACDDADHQDLVAANLDVKVSTRATQVSVDGLQVTLNSTQNNVTTLQTSVNNVQATVNTANANLTTLQMSISNVQVGVNTGNTALAALQATADSTQTGVTAANGKLDTALASLTSAHTKLDTLQNSANTLAANVATFQELSVRTQIEANLSVEGNKIVALFALPAAQGGYFQTTRAIVLDVIQMTQATGQSVGQAAAFLATGDQLASQDKFKAAYNAYGKAYRAAAN